MAARSPRVVELVRPHTYAPAHVAPHVRPHRYAPARAAPQIRPLAYAPVRMAPQIRPCRYAPAWVAPHVRPRSYAHARVAPHVRPRRYAPARVAPCIVSIVPFHLSTTFANVPGVRCNHMPNAGAAVASRGLRWTPKHLMCRVILLLAGTRPTTEVTMRITLQRMDRRVASQPRSSCFTHRAQHAAHTSEDQPSGPSQSPDSGRNTDTPHIIAHHNEMLVTHLSLAVRIAHSKSQVTQQASWPVSPFSFEVVPNHHTCT